MTSFQSQPAPPAVESKEPEKISDNPLHKHILAVLNEQKFNRGGLNWYDYHELIAISEELLKPKPQFRDIPLNDFRVGEAVLVYGAIHVIQEVILRDQEQVTIVLDEGSNDMVRNVCPSHLFSVGAKIHRNGDWVICANRGKYE